MALIINPYRKTPPEVQQPHIISRFLLNQFAGSSKRSWKYRRGQLPRRVSTKSECTEPGYFGSVDRARGQLVETWLSNLESKASHLVRWLGQKTWELNDIARATLLLFVATLFL
ncbi:DUF4238 domain-containing protein [Terriglobus sp.]|uniref:DUF4238 domain-containing protein n=1 Tax=Terriglobus sp. TaxID=1889013 RepID=UPI003B00D38F